MPAFRTEPNDRIGGAKRSLIAGERYLRPIAHSTGLLARRERVCDRREGARITAGRRWWNKREDCNERGDAGASITVEPKLYEVQHLLNAATLLNRRMRELADRD